MLLFIHKRNLFPRNRQEFQYISCYCLSAVAVPCIAVGPDFNTSHVTVYLQATNYQTACDLFQYISCYCLSHHPSRCSRLYNHFNTSHVTVYHIRNTRDDMNLLNFNTSHVTVYPYWKITSYYLSLISIHLMLLFILAFFHCFSAPSLFQYISCYCLSKDKREPQQVQTDFNTSHVTVYLKINNAFSKFHNISIHLMLLFIIMPESI